MRKSNKKRDQKRSAKVRKSEADKLAATKQHEQFVKGATHQRKRKEERERSMRAFRNHPFEASYGGPTLNLGSMERMIESWDWSKRHGL